MGLRDRVNDELDELRAAARGTSIEALRDGSWLVPVVRNALVPYAEQTDRVALEVAHELWETDALGDACITWAQRRAMMAGGLSAGAYASVVAMALATGGVAAVMAVPGAMAAFTVDLWYTARVQLQLAWDLGVLYDHPVDVDDDAQVVALCRLAFGVDAGAATATVVAGVVPEMSRFGTRALTTASRVAYYAALKTLGQNLVQRGMVRFAVPALGVPMCAAVNHVTTGRTGRAARSLLQGHARARALTDDLADELELAPVLLLEALLWIVAADERAGGAEATLLEGLAGRLPAAQGDAIRSALGRDEQALLADVSRAPAALRESLYQAAIEAAALDGVLYAEEDRRLRRLAEACGVPFDPRVVSAAIVRAR